MNKPKVRFLTKPGDHRGKGVRAGSSNSFDLWLPVHGALRLLISSPLYVVLASVTKQAVYNLSKPIYLWWSQFCFVLLFVK